MHTKTNQGERSTRRGGALVMTAVLMMVMAGLSLSMLTIMNASQRQQRQAREEIETQMVAEAGLSAAWLQLQSGGDGNVGSIQQPLTFGGSEQSVARADLGGGLLQLVSTATNGRARSRIELTLRETAVPFFRWAAFGDEGMTMESNAFVDSYDSTLGAYEDQDTNGNGSNSYASDEGDIGSNADIDLSQNALVYGDAHCGPAGSTTVLGNAEVNGATTPSPELQDMPPLEVPVIASSGDLMVGGGVSSNVPAGDHHFGTFVLGTGSTLNIAGPATVVFDSFEIESNSEVLIDATNGPVEIYVIDDFVVNSNTLIAATDYDPANLRINLLSDNVIDPNLEVDLDEVDFESNAQLYGTLYAPNAAVEINSNFELFGSLMARSVLLDSNCRIHFDENLLNQVADEDITYERVSWRVLD